MGFQQSGFFSGIDEHTITERDPRLPDGCHKVKIKECLRFVTYKKRIPSALIRVELVETSSDSPEARVGDTYGILFMRGAIESYFFNDLKRFMGAALQIKADDVGSDHVEAAFVDRELAEQKGVKTELVGIPLNVIIKTAPYTNQKGATYDKTTYDFRPVFEAA